MTLHYKCHRNNRAMDGTFSGSFADEAAVKGFIQIMKMSNISNDVPIDFSMTCEGKYYFYTGTRVLARNIVELKYIFTDKLFIVDHIENVREYNDEDEGYGFTIINKETNIDSDINDFLYILMEM